MYLHLSLPLFWGRFPFPRAQSCRCSSVCRPSVCLSHLSARFHFAFRGQGLGKLMTCKLLSSGELEIEWQRIPGPRTDAAVESAAPKRLAAGTLHMPGQPPCRGRTFLARVPASERSHVLVWDNVSCPVLPNDSCHLSAPHPGNFLM